MPNRAMPPAHDLVLLYGLPPAHQRRVMRQWLTRIGGWPSLKVANEGAGHFFCRTFVERHVEAMVAGLHRETDRRIVRDALFCLALNAPASRNRWLDGQVDLKLRFLADLSITCRLHFLYRGDGTPVWVYFQARIGGRPSSNQQYAMLLALLREVVADYHPDATVAIVEVSGPNSASREYRYITEAEVGTFTAMEVERFIQQMADLRDRETATIDWTEHEVRKAAHAALSKKHRDKGAKRPPHDDLFSKGE